MTASKRAESFLICGEWAHIKEKNGLTSGHTSDLEKRKAILRYACMFTRPGKNDNADWSEYNYESN